VEKLQFLEHCHNYNNTQTLTDVVSRLTCYNVQCESATAVSNIEQITQSLRVCAARNTEVEQCDHLLLVLQMQDVVNKAMGRCC